MKQIIRERIPKEIRKKKDEEININEINKACMEMN